VKRATGTLLAVVTVAALGLRLWGLGTPDLVGGDEGYYGTYARNILAGGFSQLLNLGREPLSEPDNKPFLFPLLLAGPVAVAGTSEWALRAVPALFGLLGAGLVFAIVRRRWGDGEAWAAGAAMLVLPPLVYASRVVMGEGVLAAFGLAGILAALKAVEERSNRWALAAGVLWGCGFLVKLWLVALFVIPVFAALLADPERRKEGAAWGRLVLAGVPFALVGGLHLALVAAFSPGTLRYWFEQYVIFSLLGRTGGSTFATYWHQPWSYYLRVTVQTCFPALPLVFLALTGAAEPDPRKKAGSLPQLVLWGVLALELFLISFMAVKLRQYSFPLMPAIAALAGIGAAPLWSDAATLLQRRRAAGGVAALLVLTLFWQTGPVPLYPSTAMIGAVAVFLAGAAFLLAGGGPFQAGAGRLVVAASLSVALAGSALTVKRECLGHRTGYREAAAAISATLGPVLPTSACFLAPEVPAFQFYLFRTGRYWSSPYEPHSDAELIAMASQGDFRAFVTTDRPDLYGGLTPPAVVEWLASHTREVTDVVRRGVGGPLPIRVFVKGGGPG
jgi:4-amino-4-deoxy-L-arabinose transferase-like glycosyltransferase